jgi:hypothetical protein
MQPFDVQFVALNVPAAKAFEFIAKPENLPSGTHAFKRVEHSRALLETPHGSVEIGLNVRANPATGTIDWEMAFPHGSKGTAHSRVVSNGDKASIFTFVLKAPPVAQELVEGTLAQQRRILAEELVTLQRLLAA